MAPSLEAFILPLPGRRGGTAIIAGMKAGIIGLPSVGKSTLFQLLTGAPAPAPGSRPEARLGIARVPDPRVDRLAEMYKPQEEDLRHRRVRRRPRHGEGGGLRARRPAGPARGGRARPRGPGVRVRRRAPPRRLGRPRAGRPDARPRADSRRPRLRRAAARDGSRPTSRRRARPRTWPSKTLFLRLKEALEAERPLREVAASRGGPASAAQLLAPLREARAARRQPRRGADARGGTAISRLRAFSAFAGRPGYRLCPVSATIEAEMGELASRGRGGVSRGSRAQPSRASIASSARPTSCSGLVSFLTAGEDECRAWTIRRGTQGARGRRHDPLRHRARLHPRRGGGVRRPRGRGLASRRAASAARCASRAASTRSRTAT